MIKSTEFFNSRQWNQDNTFSYNSEFVTLVRDVEGAAEKRNLTLSRWESNGPGRSKSITYALHSGERESQYRWQKGVISSCNLTALEGTTRRCAAYRELAHMAEQQGLWD